MNTAHETKTLIASYQYPEIFSEQRAGPAFPEALRHEQEPSVRGKPVRLLIDRLAGPRSVSTRLIFDEGTIYCDCHDMTLHPRAYRFLVPLEGTNDSAKVKIDRIMRVTEAAKFFDGIMQVDSFAELNDLYRGLCRGKLPKGDLVIFSLGDPEMRRFLFDLGAETQGTRNEGELFMRWNKFVQLCKSGKLLETWKTRNAELKGKLISTF